MNDDKRRLISEKNQIEKELEIEKRIYAKALDAFNISSITESPETMNRSYDLLFILDVTQSNCQSIFDEAEDLNTIYLIVKKKFHIHALYIQSLVSLIFEISLKKSKSMKPNGNVLKKGYF